LKRLLKKLLKGRWKGFGVIRVIRVEKEMVSIKVIKANGMGCMQKFLPC